MTASLRAPPPKSSRRRFGVGGARKRLRGLTLVEVLMVVALIALLGGSILFGGGLMSGARERGACTLLVSAVRKGLAHANASGHPVRLVMNLDEGRIHLEEASSSKVVRDNPNTVDLSARAKWLERQVRREAEQSLDGQPDTGPRFTPLPLLGEDGNEAGRELGKGVRFRLVQTDRDPDPITQGVAYLHFWPGGVTEHAVIQVAAGDSEGLTVRVSALTGRATIERGRVSLPEPRRDGEYSEREEW